MAIVRITANKFWIWIISTLFHVVEMEVGVRAISSPLFTGSILKFSIFKSWLRVLFCFHSLDYFNRSGYGPNSLVFLLWVFGFDFCFFNSSLSVFYIFIWNLWLCIWVTGKLGLVNLKLYNWLLKFLSRNQDWLDFAILHFIRVNY